MSKIFRKIAEAVEDGDFEEVVDLTKEALEDEEDPKEILDKGLLQGMNTVGEDFREGTIFVPEVLMSAQAVDAGMEVLKPFLNAGDIRNAGKIVFCTVEGDLHDIGKKLSGRRVRSNRSWKRRKRRCDDGCGQRASAQDFGYVCHADHNHGGNGRCSKGTGG